MEDRPNFYTLLGLDPSVQDRPTIEAAILKKKRTWSAQQTSGTPDAQRRARQYLMLIPEMQERLASRKGCREEAAALREAEKAEQRQHLEKLKVLIATLKEAGKSVATPGEVAILIEQTGKVFSEQEVEAQLKQNGILLERNASRPRKERPRLDPTVAQGIRSDLEHLGLQSLYDFLSKEFSQQLSPKSRPATLHKRAESLYRELNRHGRTDADMTVRQRLAGKAQAVFKDKQQKIRYDNTLAAESLVCLDPQLNLFGGDDQFLDSQEVGVLLKLAGENKVSLSIARDYIEDYAQKKGWVIQPGSWPDKKSHESENDQKASKRQKTAQSQHKPVETDALSNLYSELERTLGAREELGYSKRLYSHTVNRLIQMAAREGIPSSEAREYIEDYAKKRGWTIASGSEDEKDKPASKAEGTSKPKKAPHGLPIFFMGVAATPFILVKWDAALLVVRKLLPIYLETVFKGVRDSQLFVSSIGFIINQWLICGLLCFFFLWKKRNFWFAIVGTTVLEVFGLGMYLRFGNTIGLWAGIVALFIFQKKSKTA